eukprot:gene36512-44293_t
MEDHLNLIKFAITKPLAVLKREVDSTKCGSKTNTLLPECDAVVSDIVEENSALDAQAQRKLLVRRIFVKSDDGGLYNDVGWLLLDDVEACMLCKKMFGMFLSKFSCHACGNVFCTNCCNELAFVFEIQQIGKIYLLMPLLYVDYFFQQELVYCVPRPQAKKALPAAAVPASSLNSTAVAPAPEDPAKMLKMQQQAEFQREALARMASLKVDTKAEGAAGEVPRAGAGVTPRSTRLGSTTPLIPSNVALQDVRRSSQVPLPASAASPSLSSPPPSDSLPLQTRSAEVLARYKSAGPGGLTLVTPTPAFVMKAKRQSGIKVFINIVTHGHIPYKAETNASAASSAPLDANKVVYMAVIPPIEYQNEKDGNYCVIYDVLVHTTEYYVCTIDSSGVARDRLCKQ